MLETTCQQMEYLQILLRWQLLQSEKHPLMRKSLGNTLDLLATTDCFLVDLLR